MFNRKEYRLKNKDKAREYQRKWRSKNKAKKRKYRLKKIGGSEYKPVAHIKTSGGGIEPNTKSITLRNLLDFIKKYFKDKDKD